jgi:hypothetical protein
MRCDQRAVQNRNGYQEHFMKESRTSPAYV